MKEDVNFLYGALIGMLGGTAGSFFINYYFRYQDNPTSENLIDAICWFLCFFFIIVSIWLVIHYSQKKKK